MSNYTVTDIVKLKDEVIAGLVQETVSAFPLVNTLSAKSVPGITYDAPVVTALPAGEFRTVNTGRTATSASITTRTVTLRYFDASLLLDEMVAKAAWYGGVEAAVAFATKQALLGAFAGLENQIVHGAYGVVSDVGFDGLLTRWQAMSQYIGVNAGGSTTLTDVWLVDRNNVKVVIGMDGALTAGEVSYQAVSDADGKIYFAYTQPISLYAALECVNKFAVGRIYNIDNSNTSYDLDDKMLYDAISQFPAANQAGLAIYMNRASLKTLRDNRTATNALGTPAPIPADVAGIPIYVSDYILSTETAVSSSSSSSTA